MSETSQPVYDIKVDPDDGHFNIYAKTVATNDLSPEGSVFNVDLLVLALQEMQRRGHGQRQVVMETGGEYYTLDQMSWDPYMEATEEHDKDGTDCVILSGPDG